jgi:hypothetical protein
MKHLLLNNLVAVQIVGLKFLDHFGPPYDNLSICDILQSPQPPRVCFKAPDRPYGIVMQLTLNICVV